MGGKAGRADRGPRAPPAPALKKTTPGRGGARRARRGALLSSLQPDRGPQALYGALYTRHNVAVAAVHTHSGVNGFNQYFAYQASGLGFDGRVFDAILNGTVEVGGGVTSGARGARVQSATRPASPAACLLVACLP
jgi:hypothetical protein